MSADQFWIARYEAAWFSTLGEGNLSLKPAERDVVRAVRTYRPLLGRPAEPSAEDLAKVTGRPVTIVRRALTNVKHLGLLGDAAP